jgi:hypothetical protein
LVPAADAEDGRRRPHGELREATEHGGVVVVEVGERAAQHDGVGPELARGLDGLGEMRDARLGLAHQPRHVRDDVLDGEVRDVALARDLRLGALAQLFERHVGEVTLFEQEVVDDEDADRLDALLDGLEGAVGPLGVGEGERLDQFGLFLRRVGHRV